MLSEMILLRATYGRQEPDSHHVAEFVCSVRTFLRQVGRWLR